MPNFEPFLKNANDSLTFSAALEEGIREAISSPPSSERPEFDTFGLTPLGYVVSGELGRVVSISDRSFSDCYPEANSSVPKWLRRGNAYFQGNFSEEFFGTVVDPFRELVLPVEEDAITIARNCMANGSGAVMDANLIGRSILGKFNGSEADEDLKIETLRNSHKLVARLAMLNDMNPDEPCRGVFNEAVGIVHQFTGTINPENLVHDEATNSVDLTPDAKEVAKDCAISGKGCPAVRIQVKYKDRIMPMIEAFWNGSVDVIAQR